jgi:small-conductance mechanosensitive channel
MEPVVRAVQTIVPAAGIAARPSELWSGRIMQGPRLLLVMDRYRLLPCLALVLSLVLGGPAAAQQDPDTAAVPADTAAVPDLDAADPPAAEQSQPAETLPEPAPQQQAEPDAEQQPEPAAEQPEPAVEQPEPQPEPQPQPTPQAVPPPVQQPTAPPDAEQDVDRTVTDSLAAELAALRAAVLGLAAQRDSLVRALGQRPTRVDTVVMRDTTARGRAQEALDEVAGTATDALQDFVPKLLISILLLIIALYVVRGFEWLLEALAAQSAERRLFYKKLIPIVRLFVWAFAVYLIIAAVFNVPANSLLAAAAAVGVAVGFAAQEVLKNIFGGIVIILDQPFQVGDKIAVGGTYGEVVSIGLRSTRIVTPDDNLVSVPNSQVVADQVSNANAGELNLQVVTDLYLPGWIDVALAKRIAYNAAANSRYVYLDKPIVVLVKDEFRETFLLHLKVKAYVLDTRYEGLLMSDVTEAAKAEFIRHGLLTPMPIGVSVDYDQDEVPSNGAPGDSSDNAPHAARHAEPPARDA